MLINKTVRFLKFEEIDLSEQSKGTSIEGKRNFLINDLKGNRLGFINYYPKWDKYVFTPYDMAQPIFDAGCLEDIIKFMKEI